mmetsp:Transcript_154164/g.273446  ORF Transcript_154164/g.273446 Transcript_154164/m.273446 type:complete len:361 (+) Transcript_154164:44-1126(+)
MARPQQVPSPVLPLPSAPVLWWTWTPATAARRSASMCSCNATCVSSGSASMSTRRSVRSTSRNSSARAAMFGATSSLFKRAPRSRTACKISQRSSLSTSTMSSGSASGREKSGQASAAARRGEARGEARGELRCRATAAPEGAELLGSCSGAEVNPAPGETLVVAAAVGPDGVGTSGTACKGLSASALGSLREASKALCSSGDAVEVIAEAGLASVGHCTGADGWAEGPKLGAAGCTDGPRRCDDVAGGPECLICGDGIARHSPRWMRCWSARRVASGSDVISLRRSAGEDTARSRAAKLSSSDGPGSLGSALARSSLDSLSEAVGSSSFELALTAIALAAGTWLFSCTVASCAASALAG